MNQTFASIAALLLSAAFLLTGHGLQVALLPVRAHLENFATLEVGILGAAYFLGFAAGCLIGTRIIRRVGHIRTFAAMVCLASTMALAHAMFAAPALWWLCRAITGLCLAVLFIVIESWLNARSDNANRGRVFSIYTIIHLTMVSVGQMILVLDDPMEFVLFSGASILVSLSALPVALTRAEAPAPFGAVRMNVAHFYRRAPVGVVGAVVVGLTNGAFWSLAPVFVQQNPLARDTDTVAIFMSVAVVAGAIGQWPMGRVSDRMDRRKIILVASLASAVVGAAMAMFADEWPNGLLVFPFLFGAVVFPLYTLCAAHINDWVATDEYVDAAAVLLVLYAVGAIGGSVLGSGAMHLLGPNGLFYFTAAVHGALAVFAAARLFVRPPRVSDEHESFAHTIQVLQTIAPIDPLAMETEDGTGPPVVRPGAGSDQPGRQPL